ncbi:MAG: HupE/UreJ family protein [Myxococcaceae bacterium]
MRLEPSRLLCLATALFASAAGAHDADIVYAKLQRARAADSQVEEALTLTAATLESLAPVDADGDRTLSQADLDARTAAIEAGVWDSSPLFSGGVACRRTSSRAVLQEGFVELFASFACGRGELSQEFKILQLLPQSYRVVLSSQVDGVAAQRFAQGNAQTVVIAAATAHSSGRVSGLPGWFALGVVHIFKGVDHLAFLVALLLVGGSWRKVLVMVTAFTLAHSITLGATALELIQLSPGASKWVEAVIALSIVWVAVENLVLRQSRHRALLAFGFGLVHGFGFASVLKGYGLGDQVAVGLLGFNLGVEAGQACVVALLFPLLLLVHRRPALATWVVRALSLVILAAGGYWLVERVLG